MKRRLKTLDLDKASWLAALRLAALSLAALSLNTARAHAELVVFEGGGFLKVEGYRVAGERVHLDLLSGGQMAIPLLRVARILEDEIVREDPAPQVEEAPPAFNIGFDASQPKPSTPYGELIYEAGERHALNPALLAAVVRAESAFKPRAVSHKGAQGLMQLMPATARRFGLKVGEAFEPEKNIDAGARYLSWLNQRFDGELAHVLAAYNAGEGTVDRYDGVPPYRETRNYLKRIYGELGLSGTPWVPASSTSASSGG